jgi:hypothetical protein
MHHSGSMEGVSVETAARDGNCLFQKFRPFVTLEITQNNMRLRINTSEDYKMYIGKIICIVIIP